MTPLVSVILCTHQPDRERLLRTLRGLGAQTLGADAWELVLVDNGSSPALQPPPEFLTIPRARIVGEDRLGLAFARQRGLAEAKADILVFVDDDNVLAPDYLRQAHTLMGHYAKVGAAGGDSLPQFEEAAPEWIREFWTLLALRKGGPDRQIADTLHPVGSNHAVYPACAPMGAGMVLRRAAVEAWRVADPSRLPGRQGAALTSGEDNDLVLSIMEAGWAVAYYPELQLRHLIPSRRLDPNYLGRLNRAVQKSWMQVLSLHGANPWPRLHPRTLLLRKARAWWNHRAWRDSPAWIRWQGACGHFEGRVGFRPRSP